MPPPKKSGASSPRRSGPSQVVTVETEFGPARVTIAAVDGSVASLYLGHGAGGGIDAPDLEALAEALPPRGIRLCRVEQPYRVAGRRLVSDKRQLDEAFVAAVRSTALEGVPLFVGGRSAGARVAARTAKTVGAAGLVALAFPLQPPEGRPSRAPELLETGVPALVVQGTRDAFGGPEELARIGLGRSVRVHRIEGGDHGFAVPRASGRTRPDVMGELVEAVAAWLEFTTGRGKRARRERRKASS